MKKLITIAALLIVTLNYSNAQGNLQFNQVINQSFVLTDNNNNFETLSMGTIVVPAGKVYKIESASMIAIYSNRLGAHYKTVSIGDHIAWVRPDEPVDLYPLWLSEGSYAINFLNHGSGSTYEYKFSISAIEFNIIP